MPLGSCLLDPFLNPSFMENFVTFIGLFFPLSERVFLGKSFTYDRLKTEWFKDISFLF